MQDDIMWKIGLRRLQQSGQEENPWLGCRALQVAPAELVRDTNSEQKQTPYKGQTGPAHEFRI